MTDVTNTTPIPPSPRTIANAAVAEAIAERARLADENCSLQSEKLCGTKRSSSSRDSSSIPDTRRMRLSEIDADDSKYEQVTKTMFDAIDGLIQEGLQGFHKHESVARNLELAKEELDSKDREIQRLRANEESSRSTIMNLLQAVETAKGDARDSCRHVQMEARLRSELSSLRGERDEALGTATSLKRKATSMEGDLQATKQRLVRIEQEKIKIERDNRAAMSLAKSVGNETSSDIDFYKRKSSELQNQLSVQIALVAEQKVQIIELRRQQERSMSQNRLANMRAEGVNKERKSF